MIQHLKENVCRVTFKKLDSTQRVMYCTLQESFLPETVLREKVDDMADRHDPLLTVWDVDQKGWRSFYTDKVTYFDPTPKQE